MNGTTRYLDVRSSFPEEPIDYFDLEGGNIFRVGKTYLIKIAGGPDAGAVNIDDGKLAYYGDSCPCFRIITRQPSKKKTGRGKKKG